MSRKIFIKEIIFKNDLVYLTLSYFLLLVSLHLTNIISYLLVIPVLIYLGLMWYFSIIKKNIFNSFYKWMLLPSVVIFCVDQFIPATSLRFSGITNEVILGFFFILAVIIAYVGSNLFFTNMANYYNEHGTSEPQIEADYLTNTYRIIGYNNTVSYHYDARINLYIIGHLIFSAGDTFFVKKRSKPFIASLEEYYKYFKDFGMGYDSMNADSLEVFKMYKI